MLGEGLKRLYTQAYPSRLQFMNKQASKAATVLWGQQLYTCLELKSAVTSHLTLPANHV